MKLPWSIKVITLTKCSLQTNRNTIQTSLEKEFPTIKCKNTSGCWKIFCSYYWKKNRDQMWVLKGIETVIVKVSCLSPSLTCTADGGHMKQDRESEEQEWCDIWHLARWKEESWRICASITYSWHCAYWKPSITWKLQHDFQVCWDLHHITSRHRAELLLRERKR